MCGKRYLRILCIAFWLVSFMLYPNREVNVSLSVKAMTVATRNLKNKYVPQGLQHSLLPPNFSDVQVPSSTINLFLPLLTLSCTDQEINSPFSGSACGWQVHSGEWVVDNNTYSTVGIKNEWATISYDAFFVNFDYQAKLKRTGCEFCANHLVIRGLPSPSRDEGMWFSFYIFQYSRNGKFSVWKGTPGREVRPLKQWTNTSAINQGDAWNVMRVVAIGNFLFFSINDTLVWVGSDDSLPAGRVGIGMYRDNESTNNQLLVDWATLSPINLSELSAPFAFNYTENAQQSTLDDNLAGPDGNSADIAPIDILPAQKDPDE